MKRDIICLAILICVASFCMGYKLGENNGIQHGYQEGLSTGFSSIVYALESKGYADQSTGLRKAASILHIKITEIK